MSRRSLVLVVALVACGGDDGVGHLGDAPLVPDMEILADMPIDDPIVPPKDLELGITADGNGSGRITSTPAGIDCGTTCTAAFEDGTMVTLTAEPDESSLFTGWGGACSGTTPVCEVTISAATSVTATFTLKTYTVSVTKNGAGSGTVTGNGINCGTGAGCETTVDHGTAISLTATPDNLNVFVGWGGACSNATGTCDVTVTADTTITAGFSLDNLSLIVTRGGNGAGTISSTPAGINCPGTCDFVFQANEMVTLTAMPAASSNFSGWTGACSGMSTCTVTMDGAKAVTGTFTLKRYTLDVTKTGSTGTGTVASNPGGIGCGTDCTEMYDHGSVVTLTATPTMGTSSFGGFTGGTCSGTGPCVVTLTAPTTINARFDINKYALTTSVTGMGTITSMPSGIGCPGDCAQNYDHGTVVTLTQMAADGYTFTGWGGDCSGTGACSVTMEQAHNVTATFTINRYDLTVSVTGMGTVTANQISCPTDCTGTFDHGTVVAVTQMAADGYTFTSWGGACSGTTTCNVTMDQMKNVTATFTIKRYALSVSFPAANTGTGSVSATGIACPGDCSETFDHGTVVAVTQTPSANSDFTGWGGACSGTGACAPTMDMVKNVTAGYALKKYPLTVAASGSGTVSASPSISCPGTCTDNYNHGTVVTVTQSANAGHQFTGWSGACTGLGACMVTMDMMQNVTATFTPVYTLTVSKSGNGTGTVTSVPAGAINCGSNCTEPVLSGGMITLTAAADTPSSQFDGWSLPSCPGTGSCTVTMSAATTVTARFNLTKHAVTVTALSGNGQVDSSPPGITNCTTAGSANCTALFDYGTIVTLVPKQTGQTAATASVFAGWGGDCAAFGTGNCGLTVTSARNVSASFKIAPNIIFTTSRTYTGALPGNGTLSAIQNECATLAATGNLQGTLPGQNTRWISMLSYSPGGVGAPTPEVSFATILAENGNPTGWVRPDGKAVFNTLADLAASKVYYPPRLDELRQDLGEAPRVWTGTNQNGSYNSRCFNDQGGVVWGGPNGNAMFGLASASSSMLVSFFPTNQQYATQSCSLKAHLYCLGVDRKAVVDEPRTEGRVVFTLAGQWNMASGLKQADKQCQDEAAAVGLVGLGGTFKAFLPGIEPDGYLGCTNANGCPKTAIGRFALRRVPWVRAGDQVPIVNDPTVLTTDGYKNLVSAPNANADGTRISGNIEHWSGSTLPMQFANDNCGNWGNAGLVGRAGFVGDTSNSVWWNFEPFNHRCSIADYRKILCFED